MRRALYLLAAFMVGAGSTASAQAHPDFLARRDTLASNPYGLLVQVRGLLDDPVWLKELQDAYTVQLHWSVQLWKKGFLRSSPQPRYEWDGELHAIPALKQYVYIDRFPGTADQPHLFSTLDALKAWVGNELRLTGPRNPDGGDWYFDVGVTISRITQEDLDRRANGTTSGGAIPELITRFLVGGGPSWSGSARIPFTVPKR